MSYLNELRSLIGHQPIIIVGVGVLVFDRRGRVLLQKRSDDQLWGNPGGSMELGETVYGTAKRELFEETGLTVSNLELFNIYSGEEQHHIYPNGDEVYIVNIVFRTTDYEGMLKSIDGESEELKFFEIKDIPKNVTKPFVSIERDLLVRFR